MGLEKFLKEMDEIAERNIKSMETFLMTLKAQR